ncbi:MAG: hypothetical protein Q8Q07_07800, partial [Dehalococcoidales bacterium]|nr:hypothetical protein [Dehalococcoidales bacterium]
MLKRIKAVPGLILIIVLLLSNVLSFAEQPVTAAAGDEEPDLPPIVLPEKGNPKLDSRLNKMVAGKTARTAPGFAREDSAVSANEKVRVIIEGVPGQLQAAAEAAGNAGGKLEASYKNLLQVEVPVTALTGLANAPAIRFVRMPWEPLMDEAIVSEGVPLINADDWQTSGYDGTGVKIAVL